MFNWCLHLTKNLFVKKQTKKKPKMFPDDGKNIFVIKIPLFFFFFFVLCCNKTFSVMKETVSFVPQELVKHFIEPAQSKKICVNYEEEDSEDDISTGSKWSMMRHILNKFYTSPPVHDCLSTYGVLQNKRIGEGVSATVQLLQRGKDTFAVKIFRKKKRRDLTSGYMKALASEFCISSALHHPHIIKTFDFVRLDEDHSRYCIVMEYVGNTPFILLNMSTILNFL